MEEGRKQFVQEILNNGLTFNEACQKYNISRPTGYKWYNRFLEEGELGLTDRSKARHTQGSRICNSTKQMVIEIRKKFSLWGPKKIQSELLNSMSKAPSTGSIGNILKHNNLSKPRNFRRHVAKTAPLQDCYAPNDVWMYDFKGWFKTGDGKICEPLTITDGYSRYLIRCEHMRRKRALDVWKVLEDAFLEFGLPLRIRSDNGPPFATIGIGRLSSLAIKLIKAGVVPEWIEPGKPQQNGRHERFHLTLKNEIANPVAKTLSLQLAKMEQFASYYNDRRPHEALGQMTPKSWYRNSQRKWNGDLKSPSYSEEFELRRVSKGGNIGWKGSTIFLSETLYGEPVGIRPTLEGKNEIYYGPILLGSIDYSRGFKRT